MNLLRIVSIFFLMIFSSMSYAKDAEVTYCEKQKCYVDSQNIVFKDKAIFVFVNQEWIETNAVYSDINGLYVIDAKWPWTAFECKNCGHMNPPYLVVCEKCGTPRDD